MSVFISIALIVGGLVVLIKGADVFVEQSSQIAKRLNVSERIIGLTLVAFGTSFPELSISVLAAIQGSDGLAIGNVVGSNVFNIAAVLGIIALVRPIAVSRSMVRKDIPMAILTALVLLILLFDTIFTDATTNTLSRADALIFLLFFLVFLYYTFYKNEDGLQPMASTLREPQGPATADVEQSGATGYEVRGSEVRGAAPTAEYSTSRDTSNRERSEPEPRTSQPTDHHIAKTTALIILSLAGVLIGGELVVRGGTGLAETFGMSHVLIGLTIVAIGTSLPEITTGIIAVLKGKDDIAIGNVVGSCMFNVLFILGAAAVIAPMTLTVNILIDVILLVVLSVFLYFTARSKGHISRGEGVFFLLIYIAYLVFIIHRG